MANVSKLILGLQLQPRASHPQHWLPIRASQFLLIITELIITDMSHEAAKEAAFTISSRHAGSPHQERVHETGRSAVYSPMLRWLRRTRRLPSREIRRPIPSAGRALLRRLFFEERFDMAQFSRPFWGTLNQSILLRYVPLRPRRKCQKS